MGRIGSQRTSQKQSKKSQENKDIQSNKYVIYFVSKINQTRRNFQMIVDTNKRRQQKQ